MASALPWLIHEGGDHWRADLRDVTRAERAHRTSVFREVQAGHLIPTDGLKSQWRASAADDHPDGAAEQCPWRDSLVMARRDLEGLDATVPSYDETWMDTRRVTKPVKVEDEAVVTE